MEICWRSLEIARWVLLESLTNAIVMIRIIINQSYLVDWFGEKTNLDKVCMYVLQKSRCMSIYFVCSIIAIYSCAENRRLSDIDALSMSPGCLLDTDGIVNILRICTELGAWSSEPRVVDWYMLYKEQRINDMTSMMKRCCILDCGTNEARSYSTIRIKICPFVSPFSPETWRTSPDWLIIQYPII